MDIQSGLVCFVCRSSLNPSRSSLATHHKLPEGQRTFLLLELLGFPKITAPRKSETRLCRPCIALVKKGLKLKNEIQKLEEKLKKEVRSVISEKYKNGVKESQQPFVSLSKSKVEQPRKKFKSENERISFPPKNELNPGQSFMEGLINPEDIKEEVDPSMESDIEHPTEFHHQTSDLSEESNDHRDPDPVDKDDQAEINFEVPVKLEPESKVSRKRKSSLIVERGDASDPSDSDTPEENSDADWEGMSETDEENDITEATPAQASLKKAPVKVKVRSRDLEARPTKPYLYKYDCPSPLCPKIKNYSYNDFAVHLRFHKRRPYRCKLCSEFILEDPNCWKDHLEKNHPEVEPASAEEIILEDDVKSGNIFHCGVPHKRTSGFRTEAERDEHEKSCNSFRTKRHRIQWNQMTCSICKKILRNINEWRFHRVMEHPEEDWMRCPFCDESFKQKTVHGVEERNDVKLYEHIAEAHCSGNNDGWRQMKFYDNCEACGLLFKWAPETAEHFRDKHGFKGGRKDCIYSCRMCDKKYCKTARLRSHISKFHFRPEGTVCDLCGKKYGLQRNLIEHKFSQHQINENNLPLISCPEQACEFKCFFNQTMRNHCEQHNAKDKICEICGKGFKRIQELTQHKTKKHSSNNT